MQATDAALDAAGEDSFIATAKLPARRVVQAMSAAANPLIVLEQGRDAACATRRGSGPLIQGRS